MQLPRSAISLCQAISRAGGQAWLVGGSVRDHLLGTRPKDLDFEVHRLPAAQLRAVLQTLGKVKAVGRSFGVFKLRMGAAELDIALPQPQRTEPASGGGVVIAGDPWMGLDAALRRRDLTINAIAYDPLTASFADPFAGKADLERKLLRCVDPATFAEDPLRVLRVMQFASRFSFSIDPHLATLCRTLPIASLPGERVWIEVEKMLLRSPRPSVGLQAARQLQILSRLLPALQDTPDMGAVLDRAVVLGRQAGPAPRPLAVMLASWLHHSSTAQATAVLDRLKVFTQASYPLRARVLHAAGAWSQLSAPASDATLRWLAEEGELAVVALTASAVLDSPAAHRALERGRELGIAHRPLPPLLKGRDLRELGIPPGPHMGTLLQEVRTAQLQGNISDRPAAIALIARRWQTDRGTR